MLAQVTLTPAESKKLIAKAISKTDVVRKAVDKGIVALHPSSSTYFVVEEITGYKPKTDVWVCGVIVPKAACVEIGTSLLPRVAISEQAEDNASVTPEVFKHTWVIRERKLSTGIPLSSLFEEMGPNDVYVKGINAIDPAGNVGVLIANPIEGGTLGRVLAASRRKGFSVIFPAGLEKLIPTLIVEATKVAQKKGYAYSMGMPCGLFPCTGGTVITEIKAVEILSGAIAIPIAAGGLGGAEGAVTFVIKGDDEQVGKAIEFVEASKGAKLPKVRTPNCHECKQYLIKSCTFPVWNKPWVKAIKMALCS